MGKIAQIRLQDFGRAVIQYAILGIRPDTSRPTPNLRFRRQGEANAVDQVDARERRCFYYHIGAVVAPHTELVVLPLHHVFMDQLMPSPGDRHSPDERGGAIGLADLELAIGHRLPQVSDRIGVPVPNSLKHAVMVTRFRLTEVAGVAEFQTLLRSFQDEPRMRPRTLPDGEEKRCRIAVVPIGGFVQDIEVLSLVPHGRSSGGIQVGIGGKTACDRDGLGAPAIGLHRGVEPVAASGRSPRQKNHHHEETRTIYPFGCFAVHSVVPILPVTHGQRQPITTAAAILLPAGLFVISPLAVVAGTVGCQSPVSDNRDHSTQAKYRRSGGSYGAFGWACRISLPWNPGRIRVV